MVDFHNGLLSRHGFTPRTPASRWDIVDKTVTDVVRAGLDGWVAEQFAAAAGAGTTEAGRQGSPGLVVPSDLDRAAESRRPRACVATMLRPPAEVIASKSTYYGGRMADSSRTAAWVNMMLETSA